MGESGVTKTKIYSPLQVLAASFVGGPFAAVFVLWKNFQGLGRSSRAAHTLLWGILLALLIFAILPFLPDKFPNSPIPIAYSVAAMSIAQQSQLSKKAILESEQYEMHSNWNVFGISVGFLVVTAVIVIAALYFMVDFGVL
jgi:hypothetical protein